jgi:hypothetical protein
VAGPIDRNDVGAPIQARRHEAATAPNIEHPSVRVAGEDCVEVREANRVEKGVQPDPEPVRVPPPAIDN